ncbi:hypothetical protein [Crocosphaera sp.]|uniref:hypothetical protein n=1 Tax=Crocosphaera sp. TaxID=2729996 RepID=UPI003F27CB76|nr:hypothetical protein [Crocosphaera sp.]
MSYLTNSINILKLACASVLIGLWGLPGLSQNPQQPNVPGPEIIMNLPGAMRPASDPLRLLQSEKVQKELNLTSEQIENIDRVRTQAQQQLSEFRGGSNSQEDIKRQIEQTKQQVATILEPRQLERFREILLQVNGWHPESGPGNRAANKQHSSTLTLSSPIQLTPKQRERLQDLQQETLENIGRHFSPPESNTRTSPNPPQMSCNPVNTNRNAIEPLVDAYQEKTLGILSNEQQATLEELKGEPFEIADPRCHF